MSHVPDHIFAAFEPNLEERIDQAKQKARAIMTKQHESMEDMLLYLKIILAKHYNMPIFHEYFENKTIDQLIFEVEIVTMGNVSTPETAGKILQENEKEAKGLFDDWVEQDTKSPMSEDEWKKEAEKFMQTGDFKTDQQEQK